LVGESVPAGLTEVFVVADIAGRLFPEDPAERRLDPEPGLAQQFVWDGKNSFGQLLQGQQTAKVWVGYAFEGASLDVDGLITPEEVQEALPFALPDTVVWSFQNVLLGMLDTQGFQFGGFGLDVHDAFDPVRQILYYGNGSQRIRMPSLSSSPRMRSAPQSLLRVAMSRMRSVASAEMRDSRSLVAFDRRFQKSRKPSRCQRRT